MLWVTSNSLFADSILQKQVLIKWSLSSEIYCMLVISPNVSEWGDELTAVTAQRDSVSYFRDDSTLLYPAIWGGFTFAGHMEDQ